MGFVCSQPKELTTAMHTLDLFEAPLSMPEGFAYTSQIISKSQESDIIRHLADLPFKVFEFQGFTGNRRAISFGWHYDFTKKRLQRASDIPAFLLPLRAQAANFAKIDAADLAHVLLLEYPVGAAIGWHRDKPHFGKVIGISLVSACKLRFRRKVDVKWERASIFAEPRSAYLLDGPSRTEWQHSIPAGAHLRYSITFRTLVSPEMCN
jgi:alkylated DNA repair dioxygenase AlkB